VREECNLDSHAPATGAVFAGLARTGVQLKLAILTTLASCPDGRATLDEIRRDVEALAADENQARELTRLSASGDVDIFQSALVVADGDGFQITDAGRSALLALRSSQQVSTTPPSASTSLELIDQLIGAEERLKIFDLELALAWSEP
jgi:hypothetical protein